LHGHSVPETQGSAYSHRYAADVGRSGVQLYTVLSNQAVPSLRSVPAGSTGAPRDAAAWARFRANRGRSQKLLLRQAVEELCAGRGQPKIRARRHE
jgi:hypothetical protein